MSNVSVLNVKAGTDRCETPLGIIVVDSARNGWGAWADAILGSYAPVQIAAEKSVTKVGEERLVIVVHGSPRRFRDLWNRHGKVCVAGELKDEVVTTQLLIDGKFRAASVETLTVLGA